MRGSRLAGDKTKESGVRQQAESQSPATTGAESVLIGQDAKKSARGERPPVGQLRSVETQLQGILTVAFSADGRLAILGSKDGRLHLWDVQAGTELRQFTGHTEPIQCAQFSPDSRLVASGSGILLDSKDPTVRIWEVSTGREIASTRHVGIVTSVTFSQSGKRAASCSLDTTIRILDLEKVNEVQVLGPRSNRDGWRCVAFMPDGQSVISGQDPIAIEAPSGGSQNWSSSFGLHKICVWKIGSNDEPRRFEGHTQSDKGHKERVNGIAISADGRRALSASEDKTMRLWDVGTGTEIKRFDGHTCEVVSVCLSKDGRLALSGGGEKLQGGKPLSTDYTVRLWAVEGGQELHSFSGHRGRVMSVAFSPDGTTALSGSADGTIREWSLPR